MYGPTDDSATEQKAVKMEFPGLEAGGKERRIALQGARYENT
jgi:hypothetical protein